MHLRPASAGSSTVLQRLGEGRGEALRLIRVHLVRSQCLCRGVLGIESGRLKGAGVGGRQQEQPISRCSAHPWWRSTEYPYDSSPAATVSSRAPPKRRGGGTYDQARSSPIPLGQDCSPVLDLVRPPCSCLVPAPVGCPSRGAPPNGRRDHTASCPHGWAG